MNEYTMSGNVIKSMIPATTTKNGLQDTPPWQVPANQHELLFQQPVSPTDTRQEGPQPGRFQSSMQQPGMFQQTTPQTGMFQPTQIPSMQNGMHPQTTIMESGRDVRDSVLTDTHFTQGFLQTQIGRHVKIEFLIGTNMFIDREGDLVKVGADYILIQETATDDYLLCDLYSIKFIRFYY